MQEPTRSGIADVAGADHAWARPADGACTGDANPTEGRIREPRPPACETDAAQPAEEYVPL